MVKTIFNKTDVIDFNMVVKLHNSFLSWMRWYGFKREMSLKKFNKLLKKEGYKITSK